jgi:hypothetical protein
MKLSRFWLGGLALICFVSTSGTSRAIDVFTPIGVSGYTQDMVVEATAPNPPAGATTAAMDGGAGNTGNTYYEIGYNLSAPLTGVPLSGSTFVSQNDAEHTFTVGSYTASNAILVDGTNSGTFNLTTPAPYSALSFLAATGSGNNTINYTVTYADATTFSGSFTANDWFGGSPVAWSASGRVDVGSGAFDAVNSGNPSWYQYDVTLGGDTTNITSVALSLASGGGHTGVFALSGVTSVPEPASLVLLGLGAVGMLLAARRRRSA